MKHFSNDHKDHSHQHKNSLKLGDEKGSWDNNMIRIPNGGKVRVEQIQGSEERNKSKKARLWKWQSKIWGGKLTIWVRFFEIKKNYNRAITEFIGVY